MSSHFSSVKIIGIINEALQALHAEIYIPEDIL